MLVLVVFFALLTGEPRAKADPPSELAIGPAFTAKPSLKDIWVGGDAYVDTSTVAGTDTEEDPVGFDCQWELGGNGATPGPWSEISGADDCAAYTVPAGQDRYWIRAEVTAMNDEGQVQVRSRAYRIGGEIIYQRYTTSVDNVLWVISPNGTNNHRLFSDTVAWNMDAPAISPDGTTLAFISNRDSAVANGTKNDTSLWLMNADGSGTPTLVADHAGNDINPQWSPDGKKLLYVNEADNGLWVVNADRSDDTRLLGFKNTMLNTQGYENAPAWTPSGEGIVYFDDSGKQYAKYNTQYSWRTANPSDTCSTSYTDWGFTYSPGNSVICRRQMELFEVPSAGGIPTQLTVNQPLSATAWTQHACDADAGDLYCRAYTRPRFSPTDPTLLTFWNAYVHTVSSIAYPIATETAPIPASTFGGARMDEHGLSPDGSKVIFYNGIFLTPELRVTPISGFAQTTITSMRESADWGFVAATAPPSLPLEQTFGSELAKNPGDEHPVNGATGSYHTSYTDLSLSGFDNPFAFTRVYNSADTSGGGFGTGWQFSYGAKLTINGTTGDVTARAGDSQQLLFVKQADGSYRPSSGGTAELVKKPGGDYLLTEENHMAFSFSSAGALTRVTSPNNHTISLSYDGSGQLDSITDAATRVIDIAWNGAGTRISQISLADGRYVDFGYDASARLQTVTDLRGKVTTYAYDSTSSRLASIKDANNHWVVRNTYSSGRVVSQLDPLANQTSYAWNGGTQTTTTTDAAGKTWTKTFRNNLLVADADPTRGTTSFSYDEDLNEVAAIDPLGVGVTSAYDVSGNLIGQTDASSGSSASTYSADRQVTGELDVEGHATVTSYDVSGNQTRQETTNGRATSATYNSDGLVSSQTDARGKTTVYTYDTQGNRVSATTPTGSKTTWTYDAYGRIASVVTPRGNQAGATADDFRTTFTYDAADNKLTETSPLGHTTTSSYDDVGNLASVTNPLSKTWSYSYDEANRRLTQTAPDGGIKQTAYDARGNVSAETDALGHKTSYGYDDGNRRAWVVTPRGNKLGANPNDYKTNYLYDKAGRLVKEIDPLSNETAYSYDPQGQQTKIVRTKVALGSAARSYVAAVLNEDAAAHWRLDDPAGEAMADAGRHENIGWYYTYGVTSGTVGAIGDGSNATTFDGTYGYAQAPLAASLAGRSFTIEAWAKRTSTGSADTIVSRGAASTNNGLQFGFRATDVFTCAFFGNDLNTSSTYTDTNWHHWACTFDATSKARKIYRDGVLVASDTATANYSGSGAVTIGQAPFAASSYFKGAIDDVAIYTEALSATQASDHYTIGTAATPRTARTIAQFTYDTAGRVLTETNAADKTRSYGYDLYGQRTSVTDERAKTTSFEFDANGNTVAVTSPLGNKQTFGYDDDDRKAWSITPRGNLAGATPDDFKTTFGYDADGHLISQTDPLGHASTWMYDRAGRKTAETDANNHTTTYGFDGAAQLTSVTDPLSNQTSYSHDDTGRVSARTDEKGHVTTYVYDLAGRLTTLVKPGPSGTATRTWTYTYDEEDHRTKQVDANGDATTSDFNDGTTQWSYDRLGRLTSIDYSDSTPDVTHTYDGWGNRSSMVDGQPGNETYTYDALNRLTSVARGTDTFAYEYDDAGNITRRTYPDGTVLEYAYDGDGRMQTVSVAGSPIATYAYNADALQTSATLPAANGYVETRSYDRAGRLSELRNSTSGSDLSRFTYTRDPAGNPTRIDKLAGQVETYQYDANDRLTQVCYQATACISPTDPFIAWAYDEVGNRSEETRPTGTTSYSYDNADQLTAETTGTTTVTHGYDANGNQTAKGSRTFSYDLAGRLSASSDGSTTLAYVYDGDGKRLSETDGTASTHYLWDRNGQLAQLALERNGSGTQLRRYQQGLDTISMTTGGSDFYYHYDGLGSVRNLTSAGGATQWSYSYEPYGAQRSAVKNDAGAPTNPLQFTGEYSDSATSLYHLRARQYDPTAGRFLSVDPVPQEVTDPYVSSYLYVNGQPTTLIDLAGLCGWRPSEWLDCASKAGGALFQAGDVAISKIGGVQNFIKIATPVGHLYLQYRVAQTLARQYKREAASFYRDYKAQGGGPMGFLDALNFRNPGFWFWMHEHGCKSAAAAHNGKQWAKECGLAAANLGIVIATALTPTAGRAATRLATGSAPKTTTGVSNEVASYMARRRFPYPATADEELGQVYRQLFRAEDTRPGGTAGALLRDGSHVLKARERAQQLDRILRRRTDLSPYDRNLAGRVRDELLDALRRTGN